MLHQMKRFFSNISLAKHLIKIFIGLAILSSGKAFSQITVTIEATGGVTTVCQGTTYVLTVNATGGTFNYVNYTWSGDTGPLNIIPPGDVAIFNTNAAPGIYNLSCLVEDDGTGTGTGNISITLLPSPIATNTAGGPTTFCQGGSVVLSANAGAGLTYQWRIGASDIAGATNSTYTATTSGTYRVRVTGSNGCSKLSNAITVTVNSLPAATASNDGPVCYNGTINLTSGPNLMVSYNWTSNSSTPYTSTDQNPSITGITPSFSGDYTVKVKDSNGCENTATTTVLVYDDVNGGAIGSDQSICYNGDPAAFTNVTSPSGGSPTWTYAWESKVGAGAWTAISGETALTYDIPAGLNQTTSYRRVATNSCGIVYSNTVTVTVYSAMDGGTIAADQFICYSGNPAAFTNTLSPSGGNGTWSYSWESKVGAGSWTAISGATALTYDAPAGLTQTTDYRRVATNSCGTVYSNTITVTVYTAQDGGVIAADQSICYNGDPTAFTSTADPSGGNGAWTYSWESKVGAGAWTAIAGTNVLAYDVPAGLTQTTLFRRAATNACGTVYSNSITVNVYAALNGGTISGNQSLCYNSDPANITSTTGPSGGNGAWTYSWESQTNCSGAWTAIAGANGLTYDPPANQTTTMCYRRASTNSCGTIYSNTVTITIYANIDGGVIASDQTVCSGADPSAFTNTTSPSGGNGAWTYAWESKVGAGAWTAISGAIALTYDVPSGITQTTQYRRVATNSCGTGYSNTITVTVSNAIDGGTIGSDQSICYNGDPAAFTDVVSPSGGSGAWSYAWESKVGAGAWTAIAGAIAITYDVPTGLTQTTQYHRISTNSCGSGTSNAITVTVYADVSGGTIAASQNVCYNGDPAAFTSTVDPSGGNGVWTYSWESRIGAGAWTAISGANALTYDIPTGITQTIDYRRVATTTCGTVYSNIVTITVYSALNGGAITADQSVCNGGDPVAFTSTTAASGGNGAFSYSWESKVGAGSWTAISGSTAITYDVPSGITQTTLYRRAATNLCGTVYSNTLTITVYAALSGGTIAANQTICFNGDPAAFTNTTSPSGGNGAWTYFWESRVGAGAWTAIAGASALTYDPPTGLTVTTQYRRGATNSCGTVYSNIRTVTVYATVAGGTIAASQNICYNGDPAAFTSTTAPTGGNGTFTYTWESRVGAGAWTTIAGATAITYDVPAGITQTTDYRRLATTSCGTAYSNTLTITVTPELLNNTITADQTICSGSIPALLNGSLPTGGTGAYTYQWQSCTTGPAGTYNNISGATSQNYQPVALVQSTWYQRIVNSGVCSTVSGIVAITVNAPIANNTISAAQSICYNSTPVLLTGTTPTGGSGVYTYQWQESAVGVGGPFSDIVGANSSDFQPGVLTANTWYRRVVSSLPCTDSPSNVIAVTVGAVFSVSCTTTSPLCVGSPNGTATANPVGGIAPYTYSWDTTPIQTTQTATGLVAGTYTVTVTDNIGCIITGTATVTDPTPLTLGVPVIANVTGCYGNANGSIQIQAAGGTPSYTYSLYYNNILIITQTKASGIPANFTGLDVGTLYEVRVIDANFCGPESSGNLTITQPAQVVISDVTTTPISCSGSTDGTITITATGGTGALEYSIDGGGTYQVSNIFNVGEGYYDITVRDANGCSAVWPTQIIMTEPSEISFNYEITNITTCNGDLTGKITISKVLGGSGTGYEYSIYVPEVWGTNPVFSNLPGGITNQYYIKVRDSRGCIKVGNNGNPITINEPTPITFNVVTTNVTTCWYNINGTIKVNTVLGGTGSKQVSIDGINYFATTKIFNVGVGTYTVYIKDANGCIAQKPAIITGPPAIVINTPITTKGVTCYSDTDGEIHATAAGGTGALTYSIDGTNFFATGDFVGIAGGDYTLTVKDGNNCTITASVTVDRPAQLVLTLTGTDIKCNGDLPPTGIIDATATGGVAPLQFRIDGGAWQASGTFNNVAAGPHTVDVIDSHNCTASNSLTINEPTPIVIGTTNFTDPTCSTAGTITVTASGGTGTLVYTLNPGGVTNITGNFTGLLPGVYTVSVTDDNSCGPISTAPITISSAALIVINSINVTDVDGCYGDSNGSIIINATGGVGTLTYSIDGGATTQLSNTFINLPAGNYNVVVNDDANCPQSQPVTVNQPAQLVIDNITFTQMTGIGANDGTITVTASGGTAPLTYTLQPVGTVNGTGLFTGLSDGTYTVLVTDAKGCFVLSNPVTLSGLFITLYPHNITCNGLSDGHIGVVPQGGTPPYTILCIQLPGNLTMPDTINLPAGDYVIDVTDFAGFNVKDTVTLTQPDQLVADFVSSMNPSCFGTTDGSVHFNITGGTPPYTITWPGGGPSIGTVATNVSSGTYDFTITDANGCTAIVAGITLTDPEKLNITQIDVVNPLCNGTADGSITIIATGGTGIYDFSITGPVNANNTTGIFTGLPAGTYTVSLRDANLCVASSSVPLTVTLTEPDPIIVTFTVSDTLTCPNIPDGYIYLHRSGGTPEYTYLWSNGQTTQDLINVVSGTYHVTVTDSHGCTVDRDTIVPGPEMLEVTNSTIIPAVCSSKRDWDDTGSILISNTKGGTGTFASLTFLWDYPVSSPKTGPFIDKLSGGTYTVTITDSVGCKYNYPFYVPSDPDYDMFAVAVKDTFLCGGDSVTLYANPNGPLYRTYSYSWYAYPNISGAPLSTDSSYTVKPQETTSYYLEIRNDGGCFSSDSIQVGIYPKIGLNIPPYISAVQKIDNLNIVSILTGTSYNLDVNATNTDFSTTFTWEPAVLFEPADTWNSSIEYTDAIKPLIPPQNWVDLKDPYTHRTSKYIKAYVKAMTEWGCKDSLTLYVKLVNSLGFGNVFSPNGDGINDKWEVPKDYLFPDLEIEIYNRWGAMVWSAKGDNAAKGWDGKTNNGNDLPIGTYYYIVKYNIHTSESDWSPITGSVTIVR